MVATAEPATELAPPKAHPVAPSAAFIGWLRFFSWLSACVAVFWSLAFVVTFVKVATTRVGFPFDLEWMEGSIVEHIQRVRDGLPIYARPSVEFVAYIYNPFYYYVCALVSPIVGGGLLGPRLVSLICVLGAFQTLGMFVARETNSRVAAVLAVGMFAATFPLSGQWFDLARVDSLFLVLLLRAAYTVRFAESERGLLVGALLFYLAVFTKQTALPIAPALAFGAWAIHGFRRALWFAVPAAVGIVLTVLVLSLLTDGWYWYYAFAVPMGHGAGGREELIRDYWRIELLRQFPLPSVAFVAFISRSFGGGKPRIWLFHSLFIGSLVLVAYAARIHAGSFLNDLIPVHLGLCLSLGLVCGWLFQSARAEGALQYARARLASCLLVGVQLLVLDYDIKPMLPRPEDLAAGNAMVERIRALPGEVFVAQHPYFARLAGKPTHATFMAIGDLIHASPDPRHGKEIIEAEFREAMARQRFTHVLLDDDGWFYFDDLHRNYQRVPIVMFDQPRTLIQVTGGGCRPDTVYAPIPR